MHQAQDTFIAEMPDGSQVRVVKGDYLPDGHHLVKRDAGGTLFRRATFDDDEKPRAKSAGKTDPAPPVARAGKP